MIVECTVQSKPEGKPEKLAFRRIHAQRFGINAVCIWNEQAKRERKGRLVGQRESVLVSIAVCSRLAMYAYLTNVDA